MPNEMPTALRPMRKRVKNPKHPRATNQEVQDRLQLVYELLAKAHTKGMIKKVMMEKFGLGPRGTEEYISRARGIMIKDAQQDRQILVGESAAFFKDMMRKPNARDADKLRAAEALNQLFGLNAPARQEVSGPNGGPIQIVKPRVMLYLPDNGRYKPPEAGTAADPNTETTQAAGAAPVNAK